MIEYVFRPIEKWPRAFTKERKRNAPFYATEKVSTATGNYSRRTEIPFDKLIRELSAEVERAGGPRLVIQMALPLTAIRRDGLPSASARPDHPGVIVAFEGEYGPVKMPCDAFEDWRDNLRAITLTLQHLRGVTRYGVATMGEQYRGWTALPPAPGEDRMTFDEAAEELYKYAPFVAISWIQTDVEAFKSAHRLARQKAHPDAGGSDEAFKRVEMAAEILGKHHGVAE